MIGLSVGVHACCDHPWSKTGADGGSMALGSLVRGCRWGRDSIPGGLIKEEADLGIYQTLPPWRWIRMLGRFGIFIKCLLMTMTRHILRCWCIAEHCPEMWHLTYPGKLSHPPTPCGTSLDSSSSHFSSRIISPGAFLLFFSLLSPSKVSNWEKLNQWSRRPVFFLSVRHLEPIV